MKGGLLQYQMFCRTYIVVALMMQDYIWCINVVLQAFSPGICQGCCTIPPCLSFRKYSRLHEYYTIRSFQRKRSIKRQLLRVFVFLCVATLSAQPVAEKQESKVLILNMFDVGEDKGDYAGEFHHFYEAYLAGAESYEQSKRPLALYANDNGVAD